MKNIEGLKEYLQDNPDIQDIWFNDKGEWLFAESTPFVNHYTREEVLASGFEAKFTKKAEKIAEEKQDFADDQAKTSENLKNKK